MSEINDVDDLHGMLPDEIVAVVRAFEARVDALQEALEHCLTAVHVPTNVCQQCVQYRALLAGEPRASAAGTVPQTGDPCSECGEPIPDAPTGSLCQWCHHKHSFPEDAALGSPVAAGSSGDAEAVRRADHPWDMWLDPGASVPSYCCKLGQSAHTSASWRSFKWGRESVGRGEGEA